ncbi:hypothetical protein Tco_0179616 [Tanacetum coccineum]
MCQSIGARVTGAAQVTNRFDIPTCRVGRKNRHVLRKDFRKSEYCYILKSLFSDLSSTHLLVTCAKRSGHLLALLFLFFRVRDNVQRGLAVPGGVSPMNN